MTVLITAIALVAAVVGWALAFIYKIGIVSTFLYTKEITGEYPTMKVLDKYFKEGTDTVFKVKHR